MFGLRLCAFLLIGRKKTSVTAGTLGVMAAGMYGIIEKFGVDNICDIIV